MDFTRADFASRVSVRATVSGILVTVALMIFLMSPAGNIDVQGGPLGTPSLGAGFWVSASIAWIISVFIGTTLAARVSRSESMTDGLIHGLVVWAGAFLAFGGFALLAADTEGSFGLGFAQSRRVWGAFLTDTLGLAAALSGGLLGSLWERRGRLFIKRDRRQARPQAKTQDEMTMAHT